MICSTCNDEGVLPVPDREDHVYRCPDCKNSSPIAKINMRYEREVARIKTIRNFFIAIFVIAVAVAWVM